MIVQYTNTKLNSYGYGIGIKPYRNEIDKDHFSLATVGKPFNKELLRIKHLPLVIGDVWNVTKFSKANNIRVLDCPIKFPGTEYRLPKELHQFDEAIGKIVSFEHTINNKIEDYYAYLTIDQGVVDVNQTQRNGGCHIDGLQVGEKRPVSRSYIVHNSLPTIFYPQSFNIDNIDETKYNVFQEFDNQAKLNDTVRFENYKILLLGAYTVHSSALAQLPMYRTFLRVSFDTVPYSRASNTYNPMFNYDWQTHTTDVRDTLLDPRKRILGTLDDVLSNL